MYTVVATHSSDVEYLEGVAVVGVGKTVVSVDHLMYASAEIEGCVLDCSLEEGVAEVELRAGLVVDVEGEERVLFQQ